MSSNSLFVGVMTGTSVDGLDLALLRDDPKPKVLSGRTYPLPNALRDRLLNFVHNRPGTDIDLLGDVDAELGDLIGHTVLAFLDSEDIATENVLAIGSHGQTVRHRPEHPRPFTMQIGDPHRIAEITGITTVADFRRRDVAAGGQGAPLVPTFHRALFADSSERRIVLNIGGIANVTALLPDEKLQGFDTGPGNGLLDIWVHEHKGLPMDTDGLWGSSGKTDTELLANALDDPYFQKRPPKSTGREYFNREWLAALLQQTTRRVAAVDVQSTLCELVVRSVTSAVEREFGTINQLIVCGGGRRNRFLLERLQENAQFPVAISEEFGVDGDSLEAAAFAWLAARAISGEAVGDPAVTGARASRVLGVIYPGAR